MENRLLVFQDESAIRLLPCLSRSYSPIGKRPTILCDSKNKAYVGVSGVISCTGRLYFEVREQEGFKKQGLIRFITNCRKKLRKNLLIMWDNAPCHKSKVLKEYLKQQQKDNPAVWVENIPPYSPELNPIELLWSYLKKKLRNHFYKTTKDLKNAVIDVLNEVKMNKKLIISFFKHHELEFYQFFS